MIKVKFIKTAQTPIGKVELYNSINRIPFSITIGYNSERPQSIYCENSCGENFLELWFEKESRILYEISLIAVQKDTVEDVDKIDFVDYSQNVFYSCRIDEEIITPEHPLPMRIYRDNKSICLNWAIGSEDCIVYYALANDCFLGVDSNSCLTSIVLTGLCKKDILNIFGF